MLLDNLIIETWGVNMENSNSKVSFSYLTRKFECVNNCRLCLIELPEKKLYRTHNMENGIFINYYCKGIFVGYDKSDNCFLALLEDVYTEDNTGKRNIVTSYFVSWDRFNAIFRQLLSDSEEAPTIPIENLKEEDYVAYGGETFL